MEGLPPIKLFRVGTFTSTEGHTISFSDADIGGMANSYDYGRDPAPLVIGHPALDDPAYGWVRSLRKEGDHLLAEPGDVLPAFAEAVRNGRYRRVSARFYPPTASNSPAPGRYYLKHVGFLGGAAPAVKGLGAVSFAGAGEMMLSFGEQHDLDMSSTVAMGLGATSVSARAMRLQVDHPGLGRSDAEDVIGLRDRLNEYHLSYADAAPFRPPYWVERVEQGIANILKPFPSRR